MTEQNQLNTYSGKNATQQYKKPNYFCNNCGKDGHLYHQCKLPITSYGIIVFRINPSTKNVEFLMICRKDTLGYIDFMRGKYSIHNKDYIMMMMKQMTTQEKEGLRKKTFDILWKEIWGDSKQLYSQHKVEESSSRERFNKLSKPIDNTFFVDYGRKTENDLCLSSLVEESIQTHPVWNEPEWGFPKGRRNNNEKDYECALREFTEETGIPNRVLKNCQNIYPFDEIFMGSNYKCYKHKYYLTYIDYKDSLLLETKEQFQKCEVSKMEWKTVDECVNVIRDYNYEKKRLILNIQKCLDRYEVCQFV